MEKSPQTVAWEVHVGEQETIACHAGGAALGQDTRVGGVSTPGGVRALPQPQLT